VSGSLRERQAVSGLVEVPEHVLPRRNENGENGKMVVVKMENENGDALVNPLSGT
jgi:hypothetical protein